MRPYAGRRILLGVTGGIACYKAGWLARLLTHAGAEVDVVMTRAATEFVGPVTFEALTGRPVHLDLFGPGRALDHIRLARRAEAMVVAPASADFMARAAHGHADDLLTAILLAGEAPVLMVPAMNDRMWSHPQTRRNVEHLREIGYQVLEPDTGMLAAGEGSGPGRMPEPEAIFTHAGRLLDDGGLRGRRIVITGGPTREAIDPVRYMSNRSSGKTAVALASAAWRRGAEVTLVAGPMEIAAPIGVKRIDVETTEDMHDVVRNLLPDSDALIMAAAPADFTPAEPSARKIKKDGDAPSIQLRHAPDILRGTLSARRDGAVIVGFALETGDAVQAARAKLEAKNLDLVVANDATEVGAGFQVDTNRVTLVSRDAEPESLPLMSKTELAEILLDRIEGLLNGR